MSEALSGLKDEAKGEYFFTKADGNPYRSIRTEFDTACRDAKLSDVTGPHVLGHTFGSRLGMAGVDARTIQELGGWKNLKMVERYTHLIPDHKVAAIQKLRNNVPEVFIASAVGKSEREL